MAGVCGLEDTVADVDQANKAQSIGFKSVTSAQFAGGLKRALTLFHDRKAWRALQVNGMSSDISWANRAKLYVELYREFTKGTESLQG
jgi:starch synthase